MANVKKADLEKLIALQQEQINALMEKIGNTKTTETISDDKFDVNRLVSIIHMDDLATGLFTIVKGDSEYRFNKIGDKQRIRLHELEKIMATYRVFFEKGILIIADEDINEYFNLSKPELIPVETYKNLYKLDVKQLSDLYESVCTLHKELIIKSWFLGFESGKEEYLDFMKVSILNKLSDKKLQTLIDDLEGRNRLKDVNASKGV